ncbi:ATP-binding cassette domain-containing protein [Telmatospirillum siberiense]|uniref:Multidrug ABC transporter ATP-binding protein n=1 Tax=Telmatospirillum siberiense TaxID=382514 RepID=A0A2N3PRV3_9PROT|nr:ATP-binding cassette domain-containing protein [Telmatospirillum siberiense]PKU23139.1 multidrug ABC transporter ATP-binding protein [Telmatospirillum siberiense]
MEPLIHIDGVSKVFGAQPAIDSLSVVFEAGRLNGLVGPDGAGKTTLIRLLAGLLKPSAGRLRVAGFDPVAEPAGLRDVVAYMPQRFGLYEDLTVMENLVLYADIRGVVGTERRQTFERLLSFTDLARFSERLAGRLSGGMKQKLGLACALVKVPKVLLLDEPSVGVDPISRRELWRMAADLVGQGIGVIWSTAYLDEAERCDHVLLLNQGKSLFSGPPGDLTAEISGRSFLVRGLGSERRQVLQRALKHPSVIDGIVQGANLRLVLAEGAPPPTPAELGAPPTASLDPTPPRFEDAFVARLGKRQTGDSPYAAREALGTAGEVTVEAKGLTKRFGSFTAASEISFAIKGGEIFGLLGPNGAGKSTTFKMLCGLLKPSGGIARVSGFDLMSAASQARGRIGYMAQKFSLYGDLSVRQNLDFFAGIYGLAKGGVPVIAKMVEAFGLGPYIEVNAGALPLGFKQRLALACATMHDPAVLFLDEPTSGVDPLTRREFWGHINALVGRGVTVVVTTHFMDEAEYCDRIGLVYQGRLIAEGSPDRLKARSRTGACPDPTLEDAFIGLVESVERNGRGHDAT